MRERKFLQGNEAVAMGALYAGCRFFAGYPITPSTEVAERLSEWLPVHGGRFIQMEDEISAMAAVIGASLAGVKSLTATSGPGMSLKLENLGYGCMTEIPCVVLNVMRGGPSTGTPTGAGQADVMQARWGTHGDHPCIALTPSTVYEQFTETVRAFNLSEKYRTPVIILSDEIIGHMREAVDIPEADEIEIINREKPKCAPDEYKPYAYDRDISPMANFGDGFRYHVTGLSHDEYGFPTNNPKIIGMQAERLMRKIDAGYEDIVRTESFMCDDADRIIFAFGSSARSAKDAFIALRNRGVKAGLLKALTIWPFPDREIRRYAERVKGIIVPELSYGQIAGETERAAGGAAPVKSVRKLDTEAITPSMIEKAAEEL
ncbi:MAG: 2-oxoacid:acceptor oxidoreductase subunit alpha [Mucispirillum sp.]|nr:2-oxoacid:acceptor oxidoreductase subunit alpha [Mucispirillum sp.]